MTFYNDGRPQAVARQGALTNVSTGGVELQKSTQPAGREQVLIEARRCEGVAGRAAQQALQLKGILSLQQVALATHYARRAVDLMTGAAQ